MSKAILVIDMPKDCYECPLFITDERNSYCAINLLKNSTKEDCPLKPAPEYQEVWYDDDEWTKGYNNCVREIVGE